MKELKYLKGYQKHLIEGVETMIKKNKLHVYLLNNYPKIHKVANDKMLYNYVMELKNEYLKKGDPISKVLYDPKISLENQALGLHTYVSRVQGKKLKSKNEIRIASVFKRMPVEFLRVIVVHELAHLREKNHDKPFYKLCQHMEPNYFQLEFDMRLYLTYMDVFGKSLY